MVANINSLASSHRVTPTLNSHFMPKKRKQIFAPKPQVTPHPSLQRTPPQNVQSTQPTQVNDLLLHLRKIQAKSMPDPVTSPSISFPQSETPSSPSSHLSPIERMRARASRRRLPGPPAPPSWTKTRTLLESDAVEQSKKMDRLPNLTLPPLSSLQFMCLRKLATDWQSSIHRDNGPYLSLIPQHLKQALLAFLLIYGPNLIPIQDLDLLFLNDIDGIPGSGSEFITHLHLGYATNPVTRNYKDLARFLFDKPTVPDSWDEALQPKFANLTHLSLAHASLTSWKSLLHDLTPHLKQLTHLSLAYWPQPCLLPNSRTATIRGPIGELNVSATGFYNRLDNDWSEAAGIIQQLGKDLVCLKWLDLEGCSRDGWIEALRGRINWAQTFRGLETLILGQGKVPAQLTYKTRQDFITKWATWAFGLFRIKARSTDPLFAGDFWLRGPDFFNKMRNKGTEVTALDVQRVYLWLEREYHIGQIADHINGMRRANPVDVQGTYFPSWVKGLVHSPKRGEQENEIDYAMFKKVGLSTHELQLCSMNLRPILWAEYE